MPKKIFHAEIHMHGMISNAYYVSNVLILHGNIKSNNNNARNFQQLIVTHIPCIGTLNLTEFTQMGEKSQTARHIA